MKTLVPILSFLLCSNVIQADETEEKLIMAGSNCTIKCSFNVKYPTWSKLYDNGDYVDIAVSGYPDINKAYFASDRIEYDSNQKDLKLSNVTLEDAGRYMCSKSSPQQKSTLFLIVSDLEKPKRNSSDFHVKLSCLPLDGVTIEWKYELSKNVTIPLTKTNSTTNNTKCPHNQAMVTSWYDTCTDERMRMSGVIVSFSVSLQKTGQQNNSQYFNNCNVCLDELVSDNEKKVVILPGMEYRLKCPFEEKDLLWTKIHKNGSHELSANMYKTDLVLPKVTLDDAGGYLCSSSTSQRKSIWIIYVDDLRVEDKQSPEGDSGIFSVTTGCLILNALITEWMYILPNNKRIPVDNTRITFNAAGCPSNQTKVTSSFTYKASTHKRTVDVFVSVSLRHNATGHSSQITYSFPSNEYYIDGCCDTEYVLIEVLVVYCIIFLFSIWRTMLVYRHRKRNGTPTLDSAQTRIFFKMMFIALAIFEGGVFILIIIVIGDQELPNEKLECDCLFQRIVTLISVPSVLLSLCMLVALDHKYKDSSPLHTKRRYCQSDKIERSRKPMVNGCQYEHCKGDNI